VWDAEILLMRKGVDDYSYRTSFRASPPETSWNSTRTTDASVNSVLGFVVKQVAGATPSMLLARHSLEGCAYKEEKPT
jgi:hypothetical protein